MKRYWHTEHGFANPRGSKEYRINYTGSVRFVCSRVFATPMEAEVPQGHVLSREEILAFFASREDGIMWLGHCAFLIRLGGTVILTDPFLEGGSAPFIRGFRRVPLPIRTDEIPRADVLLLSHEHLDHRHPRSLRRILAPRGAVVPLGVGKRISKIPSQELDWHEHCVRGGVRFTALPAIHYSTVPGNATLWASFAIEHEGKRIFFAGDSAYGPVFRDEIARYGPFDCALIGIGSYFHKGDWSKAHLVHMRPEEAVQAAKDIGARRLIGMHWGTVKMTDEPAMEPRERMLRAAQEQKVEAIALRIGESMTF